MPAVPRRTIATAMIVSANHLRADFAFISPPPRGGKYAVWESPNGHHAADRNQLDQAGIIVLDVPDPCAHWPAGHSSAG
jgi:hypothetical protein